MAETARPRQRRRLRQKTPPQAMFAGSPRRWGRHWRLVVGITGGLLGVVVVLAVAVVVRLASGPIVLEGLNQRVAGALAERLGPSWTVGVADAAIEHAGNHPSLRVSGIEIRNPEGLRILRAPQAVVAVDPWSILLGRFTPRAIAFTGLDLRIAIANDGTLALRAGADSDPLRSRSQGGELRSGFPAEAAGTSSAPSALAAAAASFVELMTATDGLFGALDQAGLAGARLVLVGSDGTERFTFEDVSLSFEKVRDNWRHFAFALRGGVGRWNFEGDVAGRAGNERTAALTFRDVPVSDLLVLAGKANGLATTDMPLSGTARITIAADGKLTALDMDIKGSASVVDIKDPDMPRLDVDEVGLKTSWDGVAGAVIIDRASVKSSGTAIELAGRFEPAPAGAPWRMRLTGQDAVLAPLEPGEQPVRIEFIEAEAKAAPTGGVLLDRLALAGPSLTAVLSGSFNTEADRGGFSVSLSGERSAVRPALRLWPAFAAKSVRDYLIRNLRAGTVQSLTVTAAFGEAEIKAAQQRKPMPDAAAKVTFALSDAELRFADSMPPIAGAEIVGTTTGRTARLDVPSARLPLPGGRSLALSQGFFRVSDTSKSPAPAQVGLRMMGSADALAALMGTDGIRGVAAVDIDPATVKGAADLRVTLAMPLHRDMQASEVQATARGSLTGLSLDGLVGKDKLEGATLAFVLDPSLLTLKGEGKIGGIPATLEATQPLVSVPGEAVVSLVLDDAARARRGFSAGKQLTGPVAVKITAPLARSEQREPRVEIDLLKAKVDDLLPGWAKPAGKPGRVAFALAERPGGGHLLEDFVLESSGILAKGTVDVAPDGSFDGAKLSSLKLSPGDDMRLDLDRNGSVYKASVKGAVVDARPFLKALSIGSDVKASRESKETRDFDLELNANILAGYNDEAITNSALKLSKRGKDIRQLQLSGRFGRAPVSAQLVERGRSGGVIVVESGDAGALLRFADVYRRMGGGDLGLQITPGETQQVGVLSVRDFSLRNEPALRRIVSTQPTGGPGTNERDQAPPINADDVSFNKLQASFTRSAGRLELREGVILGPQVGLKLDGYVDFARDRADLTGTYVPAYALNNAFSQVPLFGPLLGGSRDEGLFAVNFRVTGAASAPTLTINPLSAVAPGIFRKFFEAFTPDASATGGAAPPARLLPPGAVPAGR